MENITVLFMPAADNSLATISSKVGQNHNTQVLKLFH